MKIKFVLLSALIVVVLSITASPVFISDAVAATDAKEAGTDDKKKKTKKDGEEPECE